MSAILWPVRYAESLYPGDTTGFYDLRVSIDGTAETLTGGGGTFDESDYYFAGDGEARDLVLDLQDTLELHSVIVGGEGVTVSLSERNVITVTCSVPIAILWAHAATTLEPEPYGWTTSTDETNILVAPNQTWGAFCPRDGGEKYPSRDSRDMQVIRTGSAVSLTGIARSARLASSRAIRDIEFSLLSRRYALEEYADATEPKGTCEHLWSEAGSLGRTLRYYDEASVRTSVSYTNYQLRLDELSGRRDEVVVPDERARGFRFTGRLPLRRVD